LSLSVLQPPAHISSDIPLFLRPHLHYRGSDIWWALNATARTQRLPPPPLPPACCNNRRSAFMNSGRIAGVAFWRVTFRTKAAANQLPERALAGVYWLSRRYVQCLRAWLPFFITAIENIYRWRAENRRHTSVANERLRECLMGDLIRGSPLCSSYTIPCTSRKATSLCAIQCMAEERDCYMHTAPASGEPLPLTGSSGIRLLRQPLSQIASLHGAGGGQWEDGDSYAACFHAWRAQGGTNLVCACKRYDASALESMECAWHRRSASLQKNHLSAGIWADHLEQAGIPRSRSSVWCGHFFASGCSSLQQEAERTLASQQAAPLCHTSTGGGHLYAKPFYRVTPRTNFINGCAARARSGNGHRINGSLVNV